MDQSWRNEPATEDQKRYADQLGIDYAPDVRRGDLRDLVVRQRPWYEISYRGLLMWAAVAVVLLVCLAIQQWPWYEILIMLCGVGVLAVVVRAAGPLKGPLWVGLVVGCLYLAGVWLGVQPAPDIGGKRSGPDPLLNAVLSFVVAVILFLCAFAASLAVSFISWIIGVVDEVLGRKAKGRVRSRD